MIYGFDWDGTLVRSFTAEPLPGVKERLAALTSDRTFIATNQSGPVYRLVLGDTKYPTVEQVVSNFVRGLAALKFRPDLLVIACHPGREEADWDAASQSVFWEYQKSLGVFKMFWDVSAALYWRKPEPGMLVFGRRTCLPFLGTTYIGDMEFDKEAARAAECDFIWAKDFFGWQQAQVEA